MMKHAPVVALALVGVLVAGCGGGGGSLTKDEETKLQKERDDALEAQKEAERKQKEAEQAAEAERRRVAAAEEQRRKEEAARVKAEREKKELEEEAGQRADQLVQANARQAYDGLFTGITGFAAPDVTPRHNESALVTTTPPVTFPGITTGRNGNWFRTSLTNPGAPNTNNDRFDVYTDVDSPDRVVFRDSIYNDGNGDDTVVARYNPGDTNTTEIIDSQGNVVGSLLIVDNLLNAVASPFPRSGDAAKSFTLVDRGFTPAQIAAGRAWYVAENDGDPNTNESLPNHCGTACTSSGVPVGYTGPSSGRNLNRYPLQYTYETGGNLAGASGSFTCASSTAATSCRVTNQNNHFRFVGPWMFTPSNASQQVRVEDAEYMYFGWWARRSNVNGAWSFSTFHGPTETGADGNRSTGAEMSQLTGSATYRGPAVGYFSFHQPLTAQSEYGEFRATATLTADFDDDEAHGFIDDFDVHSDWHLTLKHGDITTTDNDPATTGNGGANIASPGGVSWKIDGEALAPDSGSWEAAFYSDLPNAARQRTSPQDEDAVPTGMAGTFQAEYHNVGKIIGAFGAHKQP